MKLLSKSIALLLMTATSQAANPLIILSYPVEQAPECGQSYEAAGAKQSLKNIKSAMFQLCRSKKGDRIVQRDETIGNSTEPTDVILSCIGEMPDDYTLFTCTFSSHVETPYEENIPPNSKLYKEMQP